MYPNSTFSIVGYDPKTGEIGACVQSKFLSVGSLVIYAKAGAGAIASQAKTNSNFGPICCELINQGKTAKEALDYIISNDKFPTIRQVGIVDVNGNSAGYTGSECYPYANHIAGENFCCQGNVLIGKIMLNNMADAFINTDGDLAQKLIAALEAGQSCGGERRGQQSAALIVKKITNDELMGEYDTLVDLRVDEHLSPILELNRLLECHRVEYAQNYKDKFYPFIGDTRYRLFNMINELGYTGLHLDEQSSMEDLIIAIAEKNNILPAFINTNINGKLVNHIVNCYYNLQGEKLN